MLLLLPKILIEYCLNILSAFFNEFVQQQNKIKMNRFHSINRRIHHSFLKYNHHVHNRTYQVKTTSLDHKLTLQLIYDDVLKAIREHNFIDAKSYLESVSNMEPIDTLDQLFRHQCWAIVMEQLNDHSSAIGHCDKGLALEERIQQQYGKFNLGHEVLKLNKIQSVKVNCLRVMERYNEALEQQTVLIDRVRKEIELTRDENLDEILARELNTRARMYTTIQSNELALNDANESLDLQDSTEGYAIKARVLINDKEYEQAGAAAEQALRLSENSTQAKHEAMTLISDYMKSKGKTEEAQMILNEIHSQP
jgi:tetratricopeptide (TPR) repeat protein